MSIFQFLPLHDCDVLRQTHNPVSGDFNESCAIIGDNNLLNSSLLFQAAISIASGGDQVFFICPKPLEYRPYHVEGMPEFSPLALQCVKMIYIEKTSDLLLYLCEFHTKESFPAAIMIDDIQYYVSHLSQEQSKEAAMVKLFAMLEDTVAFIKQKKGEACYRMVSLLKGSCPKNFIKRYFRELWFLSCGENEDEYFLTDDHVPALRAVVQLTTEEKITLRNVQRLTSENESEGQ